MSSGNIFTTILMACLLAVGSLSIAPVTNAAPAGQSFLNPGKIVRTHVTEIKHRGRSPRIYLPVGPSSIYYDYPYYYSRGYYPTHIGPRYTYYGPGYVTYDYAYDYSRAYYPRHGGRCSRWHRKCAANWGHRNEGYYGCMEDHDCE